MPLKAASRSSSSVNASRWPVSRREPPDPTPRLRTASHGALDQVRVGGEPEVVVGREVDEAAKRMRAPEEPGALAGGQGLGEGGVMLVEGVHGAL